MEIVNTYFKTGRILLLLLVLLSTVTPFYGNSKSQDTLTVDHQSKITTKNFQENFQDQYTGHQYDYTTLSNPDNWFTRFKAWLNDILSKLFQVEDDLSNTQLTQILYRIVYAVIFLVVIIILIRVILNKEGRWIFGKSQSQNIPFYQVEQNIHEVDFTVLIDDAVKSANYRLAIRYYYLWLLKVMNDARLINYDVEKTNNDYHRELKDLDLKSRFGYTAYLYNYIWYGSFEIKQQQFENASRSYRNLIKSVQKK